MDLDPEALQKLACPQCGNPLAQAAASQLRCSACRCSFDADGVVDLLVDKSLRSALEDADYDARAGYDDAAIDRIAGAWLAVFGQAQIELAGRSVLEVGAGTGALTIALLRHSKLRHLFATELSRAFLAKAMERAGGDARLVPVQCDCNRLPMRDGGFDLVVGRSILHHLLDYDLVLRQCARLLAPGGKAVFFEPLLEGKLVVAMFTAMAADLYRSDPDGSLSAAELKKMDGLVRHITKESWYPQTREQLAKLEDKYIFSLPGLRETGLAAGFSSVRFIRGPRQVDPGFWSYFTGTMKLAGIPPAKLERFRVLSTSYARTFGAFEAFQYAPMGYFCFTR